MSKSVLIKAKFIAKVRVFSNANIVDFMISLVLF